MTIQVDIISAARGWIGTPYQHQQAVKGLGCDCLGLVRGVWREVYGDEPEIAPAYDAGWSTAAEGEALADAARRHMVEIAVRDFTAGDLLLFRWKPHLPAKHAGIASSASHMVHAQDGQRVCEVALSPWWRRHVSHAFRFPDRGGS
jgi:NlpC/P60 family putative phage cell wall peptidase